ncbi:hypothetical protein LXL04_015094 [Taraxacum kok-saghyz]
MFNNLKEFSRSNPTALYSSSLASRDCFLHPSSAPLRPIHFRRSLRRLPVTRSPAHHLRPSHHFLLPRQSILYPVQMEVNKPPVVDVDAPPIVYVAEPPIVDVDDGDDEEVDDNKGGGHKVSWV